MLDNIFEINEFYSLIHLFETASSSFYADDESNSNAAPKMSTNTFDMKSSVVSSPTSANHLGELF